MPRIRKKTSKRGTTNQREKIKHKAAESRKKQKKAERQAKASGKPLPNKKSKKDPGIPNNFPYKEQILAEIAEQRRGHGKGLDGEGLDGKGFDGIVSIEPGPSTSNAVNAVTKVSTVVAPTLPVIPTIPGPPTLREVLDAADVVLHVVDVRDPAAGVCTSVMGAMKGKMEGKNVLLILNKIDAVPRESVDSWLQHFRSSPPVGVEATLPFRAASAFLPVSPSAAASAVKAKTVPEPKVSDALGTDAIWTFLQEKAARLKKDKAVEGKEMVVAIVGVTNVRASCIFSCFLILTAHLCTIDQSGKSALINSLACHRVSSIYTPSITTDAKGKNERTKPYTTTNSVEVVLDLPGGAGKVRVVDTPGVEFVRDVQEDDEGGVEGTEEEENKEKEKRQEARARDILLRNRGKIEKLKDPLFAVNHVVSRADTQDLMLAYSLPAFTNGDATAFLAGLARVNGLVKKRGLLDHAGAARIILRDWSSGRFARYTVPPSLPSSAPLPSGAMSALYEKDETTLSTMRSRKEMRKGEGLMLVKMTPGDLDLRDIVFDEVWGEDEESEDEESEDEGGDDDDNEDEEQDDVEEDDDDEEAPPLLEPTPAPKRKRAVSFAAAPPAYSKRRAPKKARSHK
ncbi:hypothetical protein SERLA73DRAFT_166070 [Serpula lacrymans var. lacrymans S7.3]|uniref:Guanine nucleotide-binding protein-like 3 N-terminal domain-containing protein n=1 Tax=Serpula lacrymans var. lacrymans (strain S7.3) TaxID=936435 RepID=F8PQ63_SERL3|nr:hypothetical protein SERLA73DRAFT_166070 [Serpula lacrymans var. lacrymans S7.3]